MRVPSLFTGESWAVRLDTTPLFLLGGHGDIVLFYSYILDAERPGPEQGGRESVGLCHWRRRFDGDGDFSAASKEHLGSASSWPSDVTQPGGCRAGQVSLERERTLGPSLCRDRVLG